MIRALLDELANPQKERNEIKPLLAALAALVATYPALGEAQTTSGCQTHRCVVRVAEHRCSNARPRWCVLAVIDRQRIRGVERAWLLRVPACESGWDPLEVEPSSHASGLYQFEPATWARLPGWLSRHSVFSARWSARAAAWLYERDGGGREWACR